MNEADIERLLDLERVKRLKAEYCRFVDTKQWERLRALFAADVVFDGFGSAPRGSTLEQFITGISTRLAEAVTVHHCHTPEIEFLAPDRARAVWAMMDIVELFGERSPREAPGHRGFVGLGHYEDEYRRIDGVWKIGYTRLSRLRLDPMPHDHPVARRDLKGVSADWLLHR